MINEVFTSIRAILVLTLITSVAYPLSVSAVARLAFPAQADGCLIKCGGTVVGSLLIAQKFDRPEYFHPRPSASDYGAVPSGASNLGYTSKKLRDAIEERRAALGGDAPPELLTSSGSGLDPDISPEAARFQIPRVAGARGVPREMVGALVAANVRPPQFGFLGCPRVNVLALNLALDAACSGNSSPDR